MRRSFIKPRPKSVITPQLKLVLFFFGVTIFMLLGTYTFLSYKSNSFSNRTYTANSKISELKSSLADFDAQINFIEREYAQAEQIATANIVLKESIENLFDLVPDRITLTRADLDKDSLVLYGVTPNKDVYEFMLHAPLRSIFHRTYSSFYPLENGWYSFVSTNYLDEEEL